ncbi:hypothetical protein C8Q75DRAFT_290487 [Abortiporus biennis]|nr:hypothetical protein C8Q75DRAFT_290487 [Abortiporus biennis]
MFRLHFRNNATSTSTVPQKRRLMRQIRTDLGRAVENSLQNIYDICAADGTNLWRVVMVYFDRKIPVNVLLLRLPNECTIFHSGVHACRLSPSLPFVHWVSSDISNSDIAVSWIF